MTESPAWDFGLAVVRPRAWWEGCGRVVYLLPREVENDRCYSTQIEVIHGEETDCFRLTAAVLLLTGCVVMPRRRASLPCPVRKRVFVEFRPMKTHAVAIRRLPLEVPGKSRRTIRQRTPQRRRHSALRSARSSDRRPVRQVLVLRSARVWGCYLGVPRARTTLATRRISCNGNTMRLTCSACTRAATRRRRDSSIAGRLPATHRTTRHRITAPRRRTTILRHAVEAGLRSRQGSLLLAGRPRRAEHFAGNRFRLRHTLHGIGEARRVPIAEGEGGRACWGRDDTLRIEWHCVERRSCGAVERARTTRLARSSAQTPITTSASHRRRR